MNNLVNDLEQIHRWPKKPKDKEDIIRFLSSKFEIGKKYTEKEVNDIISGHHLFNDTALLRRELIGRKFLKRKDDGSEYWKIS